MFRKRLVVLRNLVSLGQVRVEVILASEARKGIDAAVQRNGCANGKFNSLAAHDGQCARHSQTNRTEHLVFGGAPNSTAQLQKIFVFVPSCTCTSKPMTGSYF